MSLQQRNFTILFIFVDVLSGFCYHHIWYNYDILLKFLSLLGVLCHGPGFHLLWCLKLLVCNLSNYDDLHKRFYNCLPASQAKDQTVWSWAAWYWWLRLGIRAGTYLNINTIFPVKGIPFMKIRLFWDHFLLWLLSACLKFISLLF